MVFFHSVFQQLAAGGINPGFMTLTVVIQPLQLIHQYVIFPLHFRVQQFAGQGMALKNIFQRQNIALLNPLPDLFRLRVFVVAAFIVIVFRGSRIAAGGCQKQ